MASVVTISSARTLKTSPTAPIIMVMNMMIETRACFFIFFSFLVQTVLIFSETVIGRCADTVANCLSGLVTKAEN
jgi:hypothetical protein